MRLSALHHRAARLAVAALLMTTTMIAVAVPPAGAATGDLFFSEYIEGSGNNKALEIYNGTGSTVDLAAGGYAVLMYFNGSGSAGLTIGLTGTVADGDVYVIANSAADDPTIMAEADQTNGAGWFNGDDAVVLMKGAVVIDSLGQVGNDPGSEWGSGDQSTQNNTLRRMATVCAGDTDTGDPFDPAAQWDGYAQNTVDGLGSHTALCDGGGGTPEIVISEIMYNPASDEDNWEWIEIINVGDGAADLSGWVVDDFNGTAHDSANIASGAVPAGGSAILYNADDISAADFNAAWGIGINLIAVADWNAMALNNGGDQVGLWDSFASYSGDHVDHVNAVVDITYDDSGDWPADDNSASIYLTDLSTDGNDGANWALSVAGDPTPVNEAYQSVALSGNSGADVGSPGAEPPIVIGGPFGACGDPATAIHAIQGSGLDSPEDGNIRTIEAVVVGDFDGPDQLSGVYLQEEDTDIDGSAATSEGVFVYTDGFGPDLSVGDVVRVRGSVSEYFGLTELGSLLDLTVCSTGAVAPTPATITFPVAAVGDLEAFEGMSIEVTQPLFVSGNYTLGRFGEVDLSIGGPLDNPTNVVAPGAASIALQDLNDRSRIQLDDGSNVQNPVPVPPHFAVDGTLRTGDAVDGALHGVLSYGFGVYEVQPTGPVAFTRDNPRPAVPDVGGSLQVGAFNVLNYFTTIDEGNPVCGPEEDQDCRGADTPEELAIQRAKLVDGISALDAGVLGLMEIENHPGDVPTADLVDGLNDAVGAGTYDYIATGAIGADAIRLAIIYQPALATPVGDYAVLDASVIPSFNDDKNRPALAQTFRENATGELFTIVVNHLKSKGSDCNDLGDPDTGDGQGNCNLTRLAAANALATWIATDPTGQGDPDFLITGDLNSYAMEDPVVALESAGWMDLVEAFVGSGFADGAYSYNFGSQSGYLDHALASPTLAGQVTGASLWHINADEPSALDYNNYNQSVLVNNDRYRSSDHDPVLVGLDLASVGACAAPATLISAIQGSGYSSPLLGSVQVIEGVVVGDFDGPDQLGGVFVQEEDAQFDGDPSTSEGVFVYTDGFGPDLSVGDVVRVRGSVSEYFGLTRMDSLVDVVMCSTGAVAPTPATITFPVAAVGDLEAFEGMSIEVTQPLFVSGNYTLGRFGEVDLSIGGPLDNPTNVVAPGAASIALQDLNDRSRIQLDDGSNVQNPVPVPPHFAVDGTLRTGDAVDGALHGVLSYGFGVYEVQPTGPVAFTRDNPRPAVPDVGGSLQVGAFNVLNYFTTIDEGNPVCGPEEDQDCRGADTPEELAIQRAKLVDGISALDAGVLGLMEIENHPGDVPTADLVDGLNDAVGAGTYDYIATGAIGADAIRLAIIYQPALATPVGNYAVLDASVIPSFNDDKNRPALAQTFRENATGELFTIVVNHLKSKGSDCNALGDPDTGDGQGNCNLTRLAAANALATWTATDPTGQGDPDFLITGDLNSYAMEDPVVALESAGWMDLVEAFVGSGFADGAYSYNFGSQSGYLDHALASPTLAGQVAGASFWHINADEPSALDYNNYNQSVLVNNDRYRSSDHDPVLVGLHLESPLGLKTDARADLAAMLPTGDKHDDKRIEKAIEHLDKSLDPELWVDGSHLGDKGKKVFDEEKKAVKELDKVEGWSIGDIVDNLVRADEMLATTALDDAVAAGGDAKEIEKATEEFAKAEEELAKGKPDKAIDHYGKAWEHATKAMEKAAKEAAKDVRFATFNASLNRFNAGDLVSDLSIPGNAQAATVAEIIQRARPEVLLVNEFDYDAGGVAADLFQRNYLSVGQNGADPIEYPYHYVAPSNTGVPSGFDFNNDGSVGGPDDAFGFGFFPGQYGMVVYSMYPILFDEVRTFQNFLWKDMPGARLPVNPDGTSWYSPEELDVFRLSSKSHWDVPIEIGKDVVHFLVAHPTPPVFDGPEDRNGTRNADEIRFWADYIDKKAGDYIYDDDGVYGGLEGDRFVIAGDMNSDPFDGDSIPGAAQQLLEHKEVNTKVTPSSEGAVEQAMLQGGANDTHISDPKYDTADFADGSPGNLRADYVLPSKKMKILDAAVFWPLEADPLFPLVGTYPFPSSDHRLVWIDVKVH